MDGKCVWQGCFGGLALWSPHVSFTYTLKHTFYPLLPPSAFPQGFSATLNAIVANIPCQRQTLLFSATQTKSVKDLARLSLKVGGCRVALDQGRRLLANRRQRSVSIWWWDCTCGSLCSPRRPDCHTHTHTCAGWKHINTPLLPATYRCRTQSTCLCTPRRRPPPPSSCSRPTWSASCSRSWTSCGASSRRTSRWGAAAAARICS
jgi:hypothetical protein